LAERRREGRVAAARLEELSSQTKTDITAEDALASEIAYAKKWAAETEIKVKESEAEAASPEYKDLKPNVKAIRHAVLAERRRQRDAAATRMEELRAEVSTNAAPVVAAVESTTPAPAPVVVTQPEAVVEPQTRTEIVVNSELVRERIKELIENRADLDLLEQSASGELDMDSVREQMSEMQEARREISSFNVTDLDMGGGHLLSIPFGTLELQTLTYEQLMVRINKVHQATTIAAQIGVDIPILGWPETENGDPEKIKMLLLAQVDAQVDAQFGPPSDDLENALAVGVINLRLKNIQTEIEGFLTGREEQILAIDARIRQIKENGLPSAELDMIEGIINSEKYNEIRSYFEDLPLDQEGEGLVTPEGLPGSLEQFLEEGNVYKNILELFDPATPEAISQEMIWQALRDHFNLWIKTYPPDPSGKPATWAAPVNRRVDTWDEAMFALRDGMGLGKLPDGNRSTVRISMEGLGEFFSEVMFKILEGRIGIAKPD
jgi:hypothetical protein